MLGHFYWGVFQCLNFWICPVSKVNNKLVNTWLFPPAIWKSYIGVDISEFSRFKCFYHPYGGMFQHWNFWILRMVNQCIMLVWLRITVKILTLVLIFWILKGRPRLNVKTTKLSNIQTFVLFDFLIFLIFWFFWFFCFFLFFLFFFCFFVFFYFFIFSYSFFFIYYVLLN